MFKSGIGQYIENTFIIIIFSFGLSLLNLVILFIESSGVNNYNSSDFTHEIELQARDNNRSAFREADAPPAVRVGQSNYPAVVLTINDMDELQQQSPDIQFAYINDLTFPGDFESGYEMRAVTNSYLTALKPEVVQGTLISAADFRNSRPVMLLTVYSAKLFYPKSEAIGKNLKGYRIIGIIDIPPNERGSFRSPDQPTSGAFGVVPYGSESSITRQEYQRDNLTLRFMPFFGRDSEAASQLSKAVQLRWGDRVSLNSGIKINNSIKRKARYSTLILSLMGSGGLLVAYLVTLTLMLTRVLTQQRHLGIAAALGASQLQLCQKFLSQLFLLGSAGSLIGTALTIGLLWWMNQSVSGQEVQNFSFQPSLLLSTAIGMILINLIFGLIPVIQISRVRPAQALRA